MQTDPAVSNFWKNFKTSTINPIVQGAKNLASGFRSVASSPIQTSIPQNNASSVGYTQAGIPTISQPKVQAPVVNQTAPIKTTQPTATAIAPQPSPYVGPNYAGTAGTDMRVNNAPYIPAQTSYSTSAPSPTININTSSVPSNVLGSTTTPTDVMAYRNQLQNQYDAVNQAQNNLYGLQNTAVQAGLYSPEEIAALQQVNQGNQAYRQGTLNIRGQVEPMEFQTGQQQQLDLQHTLTNQANTENASLQEQLRQNNLQAAQTNVQYGQQNYTNAFGQLQQQQSNAIAQGNLGVSQQNSGYGRYDYQQITDPNTGLPAIATIDKTTGQVIGSYSPGSTGSSGQSSTTSDPTQAFSDALVGQESGGNYQAVSPGGALGKYQIMPATLQGLGINVSAQQFLSSPQLQDQAFQSLLGQLSQQYNGDPTKIAAAYYGGAQGASVVGTPAGDVPQKGGFPSINQYVNSVLQKTQANLTPQSNLPPLVQKYLVPEGVQGVSNTQYINEDKVPATQLAAVKNQAAQSGIPVLNSEEVAKVRNIDVTKQNLSQMQTTITSILGSGVLGRVGSSAKNIISSITQSNPDVAAFNNYRTVAINALQGLGAGQGGARITVGEIKAATDNLPLITDNIETANTKLSIVNSFLDKWTKELIPNSQSNASSNSNNDPLGLGI